MSERPLRVAYLVRYLPSDSETFVLDEAAALAGAGAEVEVWALDRAPSAIRHQRHGETYRRAVTVPRPSSLRSILAGVVMSEVPQFAGVRSSWSVHGRTKDLRRVAWLAAAWRRRGIDVVRVHHAAEAARFAIASGMLTNLPVSVAVHARDLFVPVSDLSWILQNSSLVTTITPFHRDLLLRTGLPSQSVALLRSPVEVPVERALPPEAGSPLRLLAVGRLVEKKGHDLLLKACSILAGEGTPIEVTIVGEGPERERLEALTKQQKTRYSEMLHVEFLGRRPVEEVEKLLAEGRYHAAVLACRVTEEGDRDGVPVALMEAQARAVPIVTSALPGYDYEFTDGGGATLVTLGPARGGAQEPVVSEFVRALAELYRDPKYQQRMADGARFSSSRRPTPTQIGEDLYERLIALCSNIADHE
ncbi:MAG: glycosyltransferase family 4 protein [Myxococcota bacterium]|nr:glycosyltransferase family 4 protein [Myxococcota bacterium]